jgi:hypothetical protein
MSFSVSLETSTLAFAQSNRMAFPLPRSFYKGFLSAAFLASAKNAPHAAQFPSNRIQALIGFVKSLQACTQMVRHTDDIDDALDTMPVEKRLQLGAAKPGNAPSDFFRSGGIDLTAYMNMINHHDRMGYMSKEASLSFSNMYSVFFEDYNEAERRLKITGNVAYREKMADINMKISLTLGAHILHYFYPHKLIESQSQESILTYETVLSAYPEAMRMGRLIELCDDLEDLICDIHREYETNICTPNWVVTNLSRKGYFRESRLGFHSEIDHVLKDQNHQSRSFLPSKLPIVMQETFFDCADDIMHDAMKLPPFQKRAIETWCRRIVSRGPKMPVRV